MDVFAHAVKTTAIFTHSLSLEAFRKWGFIYLDTYDP